MGVCLMADCSISELGMNGKKVCMRLYVRKFQYLALKRIEKLLIRKTVLRKIYE
jgi:hypothetical protein